MDFLSSFLGRSGFLPHGYCFSWSPGVLWTMVGSDAIIAAAYFSIPLAIGSFVRQRADGSLRGVAWLFCGFIFACGLTHVMDVWTIWQPDYGPQVVAKAVTALVSFITAVALWRLIPSALSIPSVSRLQTVIESLEAEVGRRRSAEEHAHDLQQNLSVTLASIGAGFIASGRDGRVTTLNAVAERLLGWRAAEALGQPLWTVFEREGRPDNYLDQNPVDVAIDRGFTVDTPFDVVAVSRDGTRTEVEVKAALTHHDDGSVRGLAVVFRDMTQLNEAAAATGRLAAIVASSNDAIIGKTLEGRITSWNRAAETIFGYRAEEAVGQPVQMLIPEDRTDEEMRILTELAHGATVPPFETVRRAKDGRLLNLSVTISPIRNAEGRIVGASKIARDVTEQHRAEEALRESEARLRFTLESAQIGDWDLDLVTGRARRSLQHARCFGYSNTDAPWDLDTFVRHVHPDDREQVFSRFQAAVAGLTDWGTECRVVWPDASVHWISIHATVRRENGLATRMLGIVTEITQEKLAAEARIKAERLEGENRQIQEASRLKSLFLANMSHELRTPLNAIIGFADLLHTGAVPADSIKHHMFLGHIATSGRHLLQLINDVLDLSKVESGKFEFFPVPVDLPLLVKEVADVQHAAMQRKSLRLTIAIDPSVAQLVVDPSRLKQALYNYLSNAIKFTPEGGHVTVRARPEGPAQFRIEVEDNGIGIAPGDLRRLFVEFQQLDAGYAKQHQGTGLGLALTRRMVEAQGGTVGVRSTLGRGSTFHLVQWRDQRAAAQRGVPAQARRLLVIDHALEEQRRIVQALTEAGFDVDAAASGEQALRLPGATAYDAFTLNLMLPDRPGLEVLADLRGQSPAREAPVIAVTMPAHSGSSASFSIADVLAKPIRTEEIVAAMARFRRAAPRRTCVMVIDDDPLALELMQTQLGSLGIDAVCFRDGRDALSAIDRHRPDAIILDLMMPDFDGFEVLDALRKLPVWQDKPVFIWTGMLLTDDEYAQLARSARAILSKGGGALDAVLEALRQWRPQVDELPS